MAHKNVASDTIPHTAMDCNPPKALRTEVQEGVSGSNKAIPVAAQHQQQIIARAQTQRPRRVCNQFNITGGTIGQAIIGNEGPVTVNHRQRVFQRGSQDVKYKITGGNFNQANIGGASTFHNEGTTVTAAEEKRVDISPEKLMIYILEKGVTAEELKLLLEKRHSLAKIALSIPNNEVLKKRMINAMLLD